LSVSFNNLSCYQCEKSKMAATAPWGRYRIRSLSVKCCKW